MKILVIHEISYREGPVFEFQEFAEGFASLGHDVLVLDLLEKAQSSIHSSEKANGGRLSDVPIRIMSPRARIPGDLFRPLGVAIHLILIFGIFIRFRPDVVLCYSVPTSGTTAALLGRLFGVPVVHRAIDVSHRLRPNIYSPVVKLSEKLTFRTSSYVSTHNQALANYAVKNGSKRERVLLHYPPVDIKNFYKPRSPSLGEAVNLIFVGSLFEFTGLEQMLMSIPALATKRKWQLRIVGDGPKKSYLEELVNQLSLGNEIEFRGWVDYELLGDELSWADIAIVPFERNLLTDCALPQKTIQYLAAGLPVVSTDLEGSVAELSDFPAVRFVKSPEEVFREAMSTKKFEQADFSVLESRFGSDVAIRNMLNFLAATARVDKKSNSFKDSSGKA